MTVEALVSRGRCCSGPFGAGVEGRVGPSMVRRADIWVLGDSWSPQLLDRGPCLRSGGGGLWRDGQFIVPCSHVSLPLVEGLWPWHPATPPTC